MSLRVLYQDNHLIAVAKPAGLLTQADATGRRNLLDMVKEYRKRTESKRGNVFVGMVHRLDRPVSGVIVFARTSKCAARLSEQFRRGGVDKRYLAVVEASPAVARSKRPESKPSIEGTSGTWRDWLSEDLNRGRVGVVPSKTDDDDGPAGMRRAETHWKVLAASHSLCLLELHPTTGRRHQLRAQCGQRGMPIFGDRTYGSTHVFGPAIALHAYSLRLEHPTRGVTLTITCPVPPSWSRFPFRFPDGEGVH